MGKTKFIDRLKSTADTQDKLAIQSLRNLDVDSKQSYLWNYQVIRKHLDLSLDDIAVEFLDHDVQIDIQEFEDYLTTSIEHTREKRQFISDDEEESGSKVVQGMFRIFGKHSKSALGLIQSCRLFSAWMNKIYSDIPDETQYEFLKEIEITVLENTIDFILSHVTYHSWIETSLKEARGLYRVIHLVARKSALEGNNRISRRLQKIIGLYP